MTTPKLPSAEERDRFVSDLLKLEGPERRLYVAAAILERDRAVLEAAAKVADAQQHQTRSGQIPSQCAQFIADEIRKLKEEL